VGFVPVIGGGLKWGWRGKIIFTEPKKGNKHGWRGARDKGIFSRKKRPSTRTGSVEETCVLTRWYKGITATFGHL